MLKVINIAIDGPCGAGKSTIAKQVACDLGFAYLDTGAMYRALALKAVRQGVSLASEERVQEILQNTTIDIVNDDGEQHVLLDGENVSKIIREHTISKAASDISKLKCVRLHLVALQRAIAKGKNVVVDGRDIGSYVLPDATVKIYLTASAEVRAKRRYNELLSKGQQAVYDVILQDVNDRDYNDMNRDFAPLKKCEDALEVDSSNMTIEEVVTTIIQEVNKRR